MRRKKDYMKYVLSVCTLMLCILTGCAQNIVKHSKEATTDIPSTTSRESMSKESFQSVPQEDSSASETSSIPEQPKTPEFTVWDGQGELRKLAKRYLGKYQYKEGEVYYCGNLPVVERTTGEYQGKPYVEAFYIVDDMLYYLEDDGTVADSIYEAKSMRLFSQPLGSQGDDVVLLAEGVVAVCYQDGILSCRMKNDFFKQIDTSTGEAIFEYDFGNSDLDGMVYAYEKDYLICYSADVEQYYQYQYNDDRKQMIFIPDEYKIELWGWAGNLFSQQRHGDGTVNIVQLYEQGDPVWRIFPQILPSYYQFSNGKVFYYDEETGVMEYDLETNALRTICDVEPDEYGDGKRSYIEAADDNGGVFLTEMNSYNSYPNVFVYFVDERGNKRLLFDGFGS